MNARRFILGFVVVYAALMAGGSRFQSPVFRPWEVLAVDNGTGFVPMRVVHMEAIGDLGYKVGAPSLQVPRAVRFSTDQWGLRNFDGDRPFDVVTVGDSFTAGAGVDDSQTLARRLEARTALAVYNFGTGSLEGPAHYLADRRFLTLPPKVVVFCPSQRALTPFSLRPWPRSRVRTPRAVWPQLSIVFGRGGQEALDGVSPRLIGTTACGAGLGKHSETWSYRLFGHPWVGFVEGRPALRLPARLAHFDRPPEVRRPREAVNSVRLFADLLRSRGVHLIYCPIPDAGDIYPQLYTAARKGSASRLLPMSIRSSSFRRRPGWTS